MQVGTAARAAFQVMLELSSRYCIEFAVKMGLQARFVRTLHAILRRHDLATAFEARRARACSRRVVISAVKVKPSAVPAQADTTHARNERRVMRAIVSS